MSTVLFPAGTTIDLSELNMEEAEFYAKAWNLKRIQIQKGFFQGSILAAHTPRMKLMHTPHSHDL